MLKAVLGAPTAPLGPKPPSPKCVGLDSGKKIRRAVNGKHFIDIGMVEKVEGVHGKIQYFPFSDVNSARQPHINGLKIIATIAVAR